MNAAVPTVVRNRNRLIHVTDLGIGLMLLGAPFRFVHPDLALAIWLCGIVAAGVGTALLRISVRNQDRRPDDELDEYEVLRRYRAQRSKLVWAGAFLMIIWFAFGALTLFRNSGPESFDTLIDAIYAGLYATSAMMLFTPVLVLKSIAGGMNKDILISGDSADSDDTIYEKETT